ncbi:MAG TPA: DNA/RNA non-specific endonuclease [Bacteroidales bacterium]|nr:MAG: hypothetical protein A2W98_02470 [Bacteroidetes bacterium GWF2_33_38]OFY76642.1 MAG: hypothetical protein A2265_07265 [Bacteroidetes bacterium RIFOXYA12_FULL_33_9]OFY92400.1 MAG: hypothetical protein A2236_01970 [Bacteroidetes bacterium RIFOXYA2_FULL_33_7]HBF88562.1 DNA/RNA non-specific endonuclease [Bacteroidales bacterium]
MSINFRKKIIFVSVFFSCYGLFGQTVEQKISEKKTVLDSLVNAAKNVQIILEELKLEKVRSDIQKLGLPKTIETDTIINHLAMSLLYDEKHEQAKWVTHIITPDIIEGNANRSNDFRVDSMILTGSATKADYWYSGYDRGHLAPSADFRWSKKALSESYYYSNMCPQRPELNRERWAELENTLRQNVIETNEQLYVVTGGVLSENLPAIGENKVSIPEYVYKIALDIEGEEKKAIGFIMSNKYCSYPVMHYAVSIDSVEQLTGIDFFHALPDSIEDSLESNIDYKLWQKGKDEGNVNPLLPEELPKGAINSIDAKTLIGKKAKVCGTVVSTKLSEKSGATFINLDKKFPNSVFSITIWKNSRANFSYNPELELMDKKICVTGEIQDYKGTPSMYISNEKDVEFIDDEE